MSQGIAKPRRGPRDYHSHEVTRVQLLHECKQPRFRLDLFKTAFLICGGDFALTEDVVQDSLARIWDGRRRWPITVKWKTFLTMVVKSVRSDMMRPTLREVPFEEPMAPAVDPRDESVARWELEARLIEICDGDEGLLVFAVLKLWGPPLGKEDTMRLLDLPVEKYSALDAKWRRRLQQAASRTEEKQ